MPQKDLFPLLHNRMSREKQTLPQFIGEFNGVESLPKGEYPAIYFWVDQKHARSIRLSFNTPLLEDWCIEEARVIGVSVSAKDVEVQKAIATLQEVSKPAFQSMLVELMK
jgi:hypothetical protein